MKLGITINVVVSVKIQKNIMCSKKVIFEMLQKLQNCKNVQYLASIIDDSVITCDEIIETTKTVPTITVPT